MQCDRQNMPVPEIFPVPVLDSIFGTKFSSTDIGTKFFPYRYWFLFFVPRFSSTRSSTNIFWYHHKNSKFTGILLYLYQNPENSPVQVPHFLAPIPIFWTGSGAFFATKFFWYLFRCHLKNQKIAGTRMSHSGNRYIWPMSTHIRPRLFHVGPYWTQIDTAFLSSASDFAPVHWPPAWLSS